MIKFQESEVAAYVKDQLLSRSEFYQLYSQLDDLSGGARISDISIIEVNYEVKESDSVHFFGVLLVKAVKEFGIKNLEFTGTFEGYVDESGIFLESASLDVST